MQQNALLLQRRAHSIVHLRLPPGLARCAFPHRIRHTSHRRWLSASSPRRTERGLLRGALEFAHLGGRHLFRVNVPQGPQKNDIGAWLEALDSCLPAHLRQDNAKPLSDDSADGNTLRRDVSLILIEAQREASLDVLEHLAITQQRWDAVAWILRIVADLGLPPDPWSAYSSNSPLNEIKAERSLQEFTKETYQIPEKPSRRAGLSLDKLTIDGDARLYDTRLQRGALGQIWQSLGTLVVRATEEADESKTIMPHVLSFLATLHHHGIVPEAVYRELPSQAMGSVQQPPLLYMLSSRILTVLSDAAWDARKSVVMDVEKSGRGLYLPWNLGPESPGVRFRASSQQLRPEVWLELILWSCLHGGWVEEGAAILEHIFRPNSEGTASWSLISWQKVLESSDATRTYSPTFGWRDALDILEGARPELQPRPSPDDKALVVRKVSSEVLAAYVDAITSKIHVGVGQRDIQLCHVLEQVQRLKHVLNRHNLGLGFATWDVIVQRFMESGGILLEQHPTFVMEILQLIEPYGREEEFADASLTSMDETQSSPYFIGFSALPLNLLHQVLYTQAESGSIDGTMATMKALQDFTERNQRRSIEQFFKRLKHRATEYQNAANRGLLFDTGLAAAEYPAFYPQLPVHVLAQFLMIAKDVEDQEFAKWVFDSGSAAGPLISDSMFEESGLAPALVRLASATDNRTVLENVLAHHSQLSRKRNALIPKPILSALLETLVQQRKWASVRDLLENLASESTEYGESSVLEIRVIPVLIRELLRVERDSRTGMLHDPHEFSTAWNLFVDTVNVSLSVTSHGKGSLPSDLLLTNVALLASVDTKWGELCNKLRVFPSRALALKVPSTSFGIVLQGVLETKGLSAARSYWDIWCHSSSHCRVVAVGGGIIRVPRRRRFRHRNAHKRHRIHIGTIDSPRGIDIAGRIRPNQANVRLMQAALKADEGAGDLDYDYDEMRDWLRSYSKVLGCVTMQGEEKPSEVDNA